jgi:hypothetical protein
MSDLATLIACQKQIVEDAQNLACAGNPLYADEVADPETVLALYEIAEAAQRFMRTGDTKPIYSSLARLEERLREGEA